MLRCGCRTAAKVTKHKEPIIISKTTFLRAQNKTAQRTWGVAHVGGESQVRITDVHWTVSSRPSSTYACRFITTFWRLHERSSKRISWLTTAWTARRCGLQCYCDLSIDNICALDISAQILSTSSDTCGVSWWSFSYTRSAPYHWQSSGQQDFGVYKTFRLRLVNDHLFTTLGPIFFGTEVINAIAFNHCEDKIGLPDWNDKTANYSSLGL